jgi:uncharacterized membrane-anchored protein
MNRATVFGLFALMALAQLAAPASMIWSHEHVLAAGVAMKFRTAPVDPYDAFRGRYVTLRFDQTLASLPEGVSIPSGQTAYVEVEVGPDGFAKLGAAHLEPPKGKTYLKATARYGGSQGNVDIELPFDRFYMEESKAPLAEEAYRKHSRRDEHDAYAIVRVLDGAGVIEDLIVGGKPIGEMLREGKP